MDIKKDPSGGDWKHIRGEMTSQAGAELGDAERFRMNEPFRLSIIRIDHSSETEFFRMKAFSPTFSYDTSLSRAEMNQYVHTGLHQHDFYELLYVEEGTVYQNIENQRHLYPQGSFCLLNKKTRHTEEYVTDYQVAFLALSEAFLKEVYHDFSLAYFQVEKERPLTELREFLEQNLKDVGKGKEFIDFIPVEGAPAAPQSSAELFEAINSMLTAPQIGASCVVKSLCAWLFLLLNDKMRYRTKPVIIGTEIEDQLFSRIAELMQETNGRMTRAQLEEELHYSGAYLNRIVKKYTGLSIFGYGMTFCMKIAEELLTQTDMNIADIASTLQFGNRSNFYKQFVKMYNVTPAQYRAENRKQHNSRNI